MHHCGECHSDEYSSIEYRSDHCHSTSYCRGKVILLNISQWSVFLLSVVLLNVVEPFEMGENETKSQI